MVPPLYHWGAPITSLPNEHADFTEDPQVNFTAMRSPLPTSSHPHSLGADFWEVVATKHFSVEERAFQ